MYSLLLFPTPLQQNYIKNIQTLFKILTATPTLKKNLSVFMSEINIYLTLIKLLQRSDIKIQIKI